MAKCLTCNKTRVITTGGGGNITTDRPQKNIIMKIIKTLLAKFDRPVQMQKRAEICAELWPNSAPLAQNINLFNLMHGRTKKIAPHAIVCLCRILETTPDGLFEWDKNCKKS